MQHPPQDKVVTKTGLTFDDVLLLPRYSQWARFERDISSELHPDLSLMLPIISSPMDTVTDETMCIAMARAWWFGILHRNFTIQQQVDKILNMKTTDTISDQCTLGKDWKLMVWAAVGAGDDLEKRVNALVEAQVDVICIDSGHGHSDYIMKAIRQTRKQANSTILMAGNVATYDGARAMVDCGVDLIRVGMWPGSICTTRIISGMWVPQLTAIMEASRAVQGSETKVIGDGGVRQIGDIAKAIAGWAHAVMLGSMLAGYDQSPGEITTHDGKKYKKYRGMWSIGAMISGGAERYGQDPKEAEKKLIPEWVEALKPYLWDVSDFLHQIRGSLGSSLYYQWAKDLDEFQRVTQFQKITPASMAESHPHSLEFIEDIGGNYIVEKSHS